MSQNELGIAVSWDTGCTCPYTEGVWASLDTGVSEIAEDPGVLRGHVAGVHVWFRQHTVCCGAVHLQYTQINALKELILSPTSWRHEASLERKFMAVFDLRIQTVNPNPTAIVWLQFRINRTPIKSKPKIKPTQKAVWVKLNWDFGFALRFGKSNAYVQT